MAGRSSPLSPLFVVWSGLAGQSTHPGLGCHGYMCLLTQANQAVFELINIGQLPAAGVVDRPYVPKSSCLHIGLWHDEVQSRARE